MGWGFGVRDPLHGSRLQLPPSEFLGWGLLGTRDTSLLPSEGEQDKEVLSTAEKPTSERQDGEELYSGSM